MAERAFRTMKDTIEIRPIHHHLETRVRAHVFLCMLAYYISFELSARLARAAVHRRNTARPSRPRRTRHPLPIRRKRKPAAPPPPTDIPPTHFPTSSPTSQPSAATRSGSGPPSTPSPASQHPPRYKPEHYNYSTSSSTSSQSQASPRHPNPAPPRGIRHFNSKNFRLDRVARQGSEAFWLRTSDPRRALHNLLARDEIFTAEIAAAAARAGLATIPIGRSARRRNDSRGHRRSQISSASDADRQTQDSSAPASGSSPIEGRAGRCLFRADGVESGSPGERVDGAARRGRRAANRRGLRSEGQSGGGGDRRLAA